MHRLNGRGTVVYGPRRVRGGAKPFTLINVKPYTVVVCNGKILCGGPKQLPLVFDTEDLAKVFVAAHGIGSCELVTLELEDLAHKCRDPKIKFNKFYLLDHESQLDAD